MGKIKHNPPPDRIFWRERVMNLKPISIFIAGCSPALSHARSRLGPHVTGNPQLATHLLLPVPSFEPDGNVKGGTPLEDILTTLPEDVTVLGGNLNHPALAGYKTLDLLRDPFYVTKNAAVTAHCALGLILTGLPVTLEGADALVIGYGRIGKCLAGLLQALGAAVTVAARKEADRALAEAMGFDSALPGVWAPEQYRVIINTVPAPVLGSGACAADALLLDLASVRGITGDRVRWARGLPGICVPETSGALIAKTALRLIYGKENDG